ncbi:MAG TPA: NAD(P)-dependent oxidoreductase [Gaiellaceae bacterium]|nr:NAD(P)-dependent oxidoreductase [Gaiellaceae bacterium]
MSVGASPERTTVGWIGTGVMGSSMCGHLIDGGYRTSVYSRTRERAEPLVAKGASWADSPAEVAAAADVVFTMVGFPSDVRHVVLADDGVLAGARPGSVLVDMTTSEPSLAREISDLAQAKSVASLDAPVSGGDVGARNAALSIMVGGDEGALAAVRPLLELMGKTIVHQGPAGAGQHTKMVNQTLIATGMIGICEALLYAYRAGLDIETVLESVSGGAAGSWSLSNYVPRILNGDFEPGFFVEHFLKDMEIALAEARRMNLALPGLSLAHELYLALRAQGGGRRGTQALVLALARLSDVDWPDGSAGASP